MLSVGPSLWVNAGHRSRTHGGMGEWVGWRDEQQSTDARVCVAQTKTGLLWACLPQSGLCVCVRLRFPPASPRLVLSVAPLSLVECFSNSSAHKNLLGILIIFRD